MSLLYLKNEINLGDFSDGFHSFNELYHYRALYNALAFNYINEHSSHPVGKSIRHSDGELCFGGGWFVVFAVLPTGQITNHYKMEYWELFKIPEFEKSIEYDGHSPDEAASRIEEYLKKF